MDLIVPGKCRSCESIHIDWPDFSCAKHKETNFRIVPCLRRDTYVAPVGIIPTPYKKPVAKRSKSRKSASP